jgi:hypothetical protein
MVYSVEQALVLSFPGLAPALVAEVEPAPRAPLGKSTFRRTSANSSRPIPRSRPRSWTPISNRSLGEGVSYVIPIVSVGPPGGLGSPWSQCTWSARPAIRRVLQKALVKTVSTSPSTCLSPLGSSLGKLGEWPTRKCPQPRPPPLPVAASRT